MTNSSPLRIALRCPPGAIPAWQADCIDRLRACDAATLAYVVVAESQRRTGESPAWRAYRSVLEGRLSATTPVESDGGDVDRVGLDGRSVDGSVDGTPAGADVLLDLVGGPIPDPSRSTLPEAIWRFSPADLPGLREVRAGEATVHAALVGTARTGDREVLRAGVFPTDARSARRTVDRVLFGMARWPAQAARDATNGVLADGSADPPALEEDPNASVGALLARQARALIAEATGGNAGWTIGISQQSIHEVARNPDGNRFEWLPRSDPHRFVADPFPARIDGESYLFFEEYRYETGLGILSVLPLDGPLRLEAARPVMERPFHLSYPYPFEYGGETYVIPETAMAGEVALFRLSAPDDWERVGTLLEEPALDASVVEYDDRWWLFCTRLDDLPETHLHVYHADEPTGEWTAHANNPVKTDVRSARPAGTPWIHEGELYRPAQDCAGGYGRAIAINRTETLSPTAFSEERVGTIAPDPDGAYPDGRHTLSTDGEITAIDANASVFDASHAAIRLRAIGRALSGAVSRRRRT